MPKPIYNMDFTSERPNQGSQSSAQKFYSMMSIVQLNESALNQFAHITNDIDASALLFQREDSESKSKSNSNNNVMDDLEEGKGKGGEGDPGKVETGVGTYYASLEKREEYYSSNDSKEGRTSPNKKSLLQSSLRLELPKKSQKSQKNETQASKAQIKQIKLFQNSIQKTELSDKFALDTSSISMTLQKKEKPKQKPKSPKNEIKKFRIQRPDQAFNQLEQEKINQKEREKRQELDKVKKIVDENINATKNLLSEENQTILSNILTMTARKSVMVNQRNTISDAKLQNISGEQKFSSSCLFRLPSSPSILHEVSHSTSQLNTDFYYKYPFTLSKTELSINNGYSIPFYLITKIKIIHNEYNRPQIKITYGQTGEDLSLAESHTSVRSDVRGRDEEGKGEKGEGELVVFMCQCYEIVFVVFSWVLYWKLVGMGIGIAKKGVSGDGSPKLIKNQGKKQEWNMNFNYPIEGIILKRSKYLKNWQKRYIKIKNHFLKSHRVTTESPKKPQHSGVVEKISKQSTFELQNIKELWTRFEILQKNYLVLKIFKKNKMEKYQFGIPITNFQDFNAKDNWLFAFVAMLRGQI